MLAELKRELGQLVVQTTATVTGKILTLAGQRRLAEEAGRPLAVRREFKPNYGTPNNPHGKPTDFSASVS